MTKKLKQSLKNKGLNIFIIAKYIFVHNMFLSLSHLFRNEN